MFLLTTEITCSCLLAVHDSSSWNGKKSSSPLFLFAAVIATTSEKEALEPTKFPPGERGVVHRESASGYRKPEKNFKRDLIL